MSRRFLVITIVVCFVIALIFDYFIEVPNRYADGVITGCAIVTGIIIVRYFTDRQKKNKE